MSQATTIRIKLPHRFYDDHAARDLPSGTELKRTSRDVHVELTHADALDLLNDAAFYSDSEQFDMTDPTLRGLVASARATERRLREAIATATEDAPAARPTLRERLEAIDPRAGERRLAERLAAKRAQRQ